ncbi:sugar ABC transporter permease [Thioclava nitratireducens]|uniref:Sugar ABC transporter permease n=2 Tax=Paracoccaceae TaxID=31989 RepID=A0ABN4X838_9RHOB|nr:sugar ABC transporter permease [Thioclava nitratireducens]
MTRATRPRWRVGYEERSAMLFLAPVMAVLGAVAVFPIAYSLYISFFSMKLTRPNRTPFVGLKNYTDLLGDEAFWGAVWRTVSFSLVSVTAIALIALLVSLLLNQEFRGRRILSTILLVPWAIPYVANALMWKWIYDSSYGALNGLLYQLDFIDKYMVWLGDQDKTLFLIANAFVWKEVPLATILLLVSLKSIPSDLYAAARVDGATVWQRFVHVTLPAMKPGFMLVMIYETMMAIRHFDLFFILTEGGPGSASHVLSWHIYVETFRNLSFGSGAAMSYLLAIATFALSYLFIRTLGRKI